MTRNAIFRAATSSLLTACRETRVDIAVSSIVILVVPPSTQGLRRITSHWSPAHTLLTPRSFHAYPTEHARPGIAVLRQPWQGCGVCECRLTWTIETAYKFRLRVNDWRQENKSPDIHNKEDP
jgi:hypothetical protein